MLKKIGKKGENPCKSGASFQEYILYVALVIYVSNCNHNVQFLKLYKWRHLRVFTSANRDCLRMSCKEGLRCVGYNDDRL